MTILNFPDDPASVNNVFVAPNGVTYLYDGVKWVGKSNTASSNLGTVTENIIPYTDNTYDLGSPSKKWRHVYTASGSIYLDNIKLTNNAGKLEITKVINPGEETEEPDPEDSNAGSSVTDRLVNGEHSFSLNSDGTVSLDGSPFTGGGGSSYNQSLNSSDPVAFRTVRADAVTIQAEDPYAFEVRVTDPLADVAPVTFTRRNNHPTDVDPIAPGLTLKRNQGGGAIFNSESESSWSGGTSPAGTRWNADGWDDLTNVHTRTYTDFENVFNGYNIGEIVTHKYLVMHDTINDQYWAFKFEWWQPGNGSGSGATLDGKGGFSYTRYPIDTVNGFVRFVRLYSDDETVGDSIGPDLTIVRATNGGGIYNSEVEGAWDPDTSPANTLWNDEGWNDLSLVGDRNFYPLYTAVHGRLGNHLVDRELVMKDVTNNKYYTVKFTEWGENNGGSFTYIRRELQNTEYQSGLRFPDHTVQKTAYIPYKNLVLDDETGTISVADGSDLNLETTADYGINSDININSTGGLYLNSYGGEINLLSSQQVWLGAGDSEFLDWWWPGSNVQWIDQTLVVYCPTWWSQYPYFAQYLTNTYSIQFRTLDNVWHNTSTSANATYDSGTSIFTFPIYENNTTGSTDVNVFRYRDLNYQGTEWWTFGRDGVLELPSNGNNVPAIRHRNTFTSAAEGYVNSSGGVIWTSREHWITSVKLNIQIEVQEVGGDGSWHTQMCEANIAKRSNSTGDPVMTVYGVTHTSVDVLATFTVQKNMTTNKIEVVATPTAAAVAQGLQYRIHSVEFGSRD